MDRKAYLHKPIIASTKFFHPDVKTSIHPLQVFLIVKQQCCLLLLRWYRVENILRKCLKWNEDRYWQHLIQMDSEERWRNVLELLIDGLWKEKSRIVQVVDDKKILLVHRDYFVEEIEANCWCTLSDLKKGLFERFNVTASTEAIRLHLDAFL